MISINIDERRIDEIFQDLDQCHSPGAAVGVGIAGRPIYRKAFGLANLELPVVLSPTMRMRIGSISKHFTALAYLLLCEEGLATLEDPIGKYFPQFNPICHRITMRQLMGHVSGLRDAFDIIHQFSGTKNIVPSADIINLYTNISEVSSSPGESWNYNNGGYLILSTVIEKITSKTLETVLVERIFEPLGMSNTKLRRIDNDFVPNSATLHLQRPQGGFERGFFYGTAFAGEGGIVSTVDDMLIWMRHMDRPLVGTPATWQAMRTAGHLNNGTCTRYGLGLFAAPYRGVETIYHSGGGMGGNAQMLKVSAYDLDIIVMVNRGDIFAVTLAEAIVDVCLNGLEPRPSPNLGGRTDRGLFRSDLTGRTIELTSSDGRVGASIDGVDVSVLRDADGILRPSGIFAYANQSIEIQQVAGETLLRFDDYGAIDTLSRVGRALEDDAEELTGVFECSAVGVTAQIVQAESGFRLLTKGEFGSAEYDLICLGRRIWRARSIGYWFWGGIIHFDESKQVFSFSSLRTPNLKFERISKLARTNGCL